MGPFCHNIKTMRYVLLDRCRLSTTGIQSPKWFTLNPLNVSKEDVVMYAYSQKFLLTQNEKIPKSLAFRLNQVCPNCYLYKCSCRRKDAKIKQCHQCFTMFINRQCFRSIIDRLTNIRFDCKKCFQNASKIISNYNKSRELKETTIQYAKKNLKHIHNFKYSLRLIENKNIILPPVVLWRSNPNLCSGIIKLLKRNLSYKDCKKDLLINPDPISFINNGKNNCFRKILLSKKSLRSGRSVVVPSPFCKSNEIILNRKMWKSMNYPKYVLAIRYPVIDTRAFTLHKVTKTWDHPVCGITPAITEVTNLDFDGDQLSFYALGNNASLVEALSFIDPKTSFTAMGEIRTNYTVDQLESLYKYCGLTKKKIYSWLLEKYILTDSKTAFNIFENIRRQLIKLNRIVKPTVTYYWLYNFLLEFMFIYDFESFFETWNKQLFFNDSIFSNYINCMDGERWRLEHIFLMLKYLRGLNKIEYILEAFNCRPALSKSGIEATGYTTYKMEFLLHELYYAENNIYCGHRVAYNNLRRICSPILSREQLINLALKRLPIKNISSL